tara:strand:+ start:85 stop:252 length:168 start_codon:yes stop_codon:yes gene_type:complete
MIFDCCAVYGTYWQETAALTAFFIDDQRVSGGKFWCYRQVIFLGQSTAVDDDRPS